LFFSVNPADEAVERDSCAANQPGDVIHLGLAEKRQLMCGDELRFHFEQRTARLTQKLTRFAVRETSMSFRNIADNADRRTPQLRNQSVHLLPRKRRRHIVDSNDNFKRSLERNQIPE